MNNQEKVLIENYLKEIKREDLTCEALYVRSYAEVKAILQLDYWNDEKFQGLLTPSIWNSNRDSIVKKLNMECFKTDKYNALLTPTIFVISENNITENIKIFEEYEIENYITTSVIRKDPRDTKLLIEYMQEKGIDLIVDNKLNPVLNTTKKNLKEKYNIDLVELRKEKGKILSKKL